MTRTALLLTFCSTFLVGCWPYLSGPYEDYVDGGGTDGDNGTGRDPDLVATLAGELQVFTLRGSYWGDDASDGDPLGGQVVVWLTEGDDGLDVFDRWTGGLGRCRSTSSVASGFNDEGEPLSGPDELIVAGSDVFRVPWLDENSLWGVSLGDNQRVPSRDEFELRATETAEYGTLQADELFTFPRQLSVNQPEISGSGVDTVSRSAVTVEWVGQSTGVIVRFLPADDEGQTIDDVVCSVDGDTTSLTVTPSEVPGLEEGASLVLLIGNVTRGSGTVADGIVNGTGAIDWQQGAVFLE